MLAWQIWKKAMRPQGKAVLDGGAARTLGSVIALERLMAINHEKKGNSGLASLNEGPFDFSMASLRSLGAVIDFAEDLVVFRKLTDQKIIPLERSCTGHQLLSMTTDWYKGAFSTAKPVPT